MTGTWPSNKKVKISTDESIVLTADLGGSKTVDINFEGINMAGDNETAITVTKQINVGEIEGALFGTWSGTFYYNVAFGDVDGSENTEPTPMPDEPVVVYENFTITTENRSEIGYTAEVTNLNIPATFVGSGNNGTVAEDDYKVVAIGAGAFQDAVQLTSVTIPDTVTSIGDNAFNTPTGVENVVYNGTQEDWNTITKGVDWNGSAGDENVIFSSVAESCDHSSKVTKGAKDATCTISGYTGDIYCSDCNTKISSGSVIEELGHDIEVRNKQDATCTVDGYTGDTYCNDCGTTIHTGSTIEKIGHSTETRNQKDATCTVEGYTGDSVCTRCETVIESGYSIDKLSHIEEVRNERGATCTVNGYTGDKYCRVCNTLLESGSEIPAQHTLNDNGICTVCGDKGQCKHLNTEVQNKEDATCTTAGYTGDKYCNDCEKVVQRGSTIDALGHTEEIQGYVQVSCTVNGYTGDTVCSVCKQTIKTGSEITAPGHIEETRDHKDATCTVEGYTGDIYCKTCNTLLAEGSTIEILGHDFGVDGAGDTCSRCNNGVEEFTVTEYNRVAIGYNGGNELSIPATFIGDGDNETTKGQKYEVTTIGDYAFYGSEIAHITIPETVVSIEEDAFVGCDCIWDLEVSSNNEYFHMVDNGLYDINNTKLYRVKRCESFNILDGVETIGAGAFTNNGGLITVRIPDSVNNIGHNAFNNCYELRTVTIPEGVTKIDDGTFYGCNLLKSVTIPSTVTSIGTSAFSDCESLASIFIPNSVNSIAPFAFSYGYYSLQIYYDGTEDEWDEATERYPVSNFENTVYYLADCEKYTITAENSDEFTLLYAGSYICMEANDIEQWAIPMAFTGDGTAGTKKGTQYIVTAIGDKAFYNKFSEEEDGIGIKIPNSVTFIGDEAFGYNSDLLYINIPSGVESIGAHCFRSCDSLQYVNIPEGVKTIQDGAFSGCSALRSIHLPMSIERVGYYPFEGCSSLKYVSALNLSNLAAGIIDNSYGFYSNLSVVFTGLDPIFVDEYNSRDAFGDTLTSENSSTIHEYFFETDTLYIPFARNIEYLGTGEYFDKLITKLVIPNKVEKISEVAFNRLGGSQNLIIYQGTVDEWDNIIKEDGWHYSNYCDDWNRVYCMEDGVIIQF